MIVLALDATLCLLLVVTIIYCFKLNGRIRLLQDSKSELRQLIDQFNESTSRAETSIANLKSASKQTAEMLQNKIEKANFLASDISFMIDRGEKIAEVLDDGIAHARGNVKRPAPEVERHASPQQQDKLAALRQVAAGARKPEENRQKPEPALVTPKPAPAPVKEKAAAAPAKPVSSIESVLEKISPQGRAPGQPGISARPRSQAEKELLEALRSSRS